MTSAAVQTDGRRLRAARSREAVVDAMLALYEEGHVRPGAALVAERAGVSQSSVFRHFEELEDLARTAMERQWDRIRPYFVPPPAEGTLDQRIDALADRRTRLYDVAGPVLRAARLIAPDSVTVRDALALRRSILRSQLDDLFDAELATLTTAGRRLTLDALDVAAGLEQIESLRIDRGMSRQRTAKIVALTVRGVLATTEVVG